MGQGDPGGGLGDRGQVVGQPDDPERVDERRGRGEVAEPAAGEGEGLGHGPADREPRDSRGSSSSALGVPAPGELVISLVDDDHTARRTSQMALMVSSSTAVPVGLFGLGIKHHVRPGFSHRGHGRVRVDGEVVAARERCANRCGCRGRTPDTSSTSARTRAPSGPGPANAMQHVQHHLVAAVGRPDLLGGQPVAQVARQIGTQGQCVAFRDIGSSTAPPRRLRRRSR